MDALSVQNKIELFLLTTKGFLLSLMLKIHVMGLFISGSVLISTLGEQDLPSEF